LATLLANNELLTHAAQVVIVGTRGDDATDALLKAVYTTCAPNRVVQVVAPADSLPEDHPAKGKGQIDGQGTAYVCHGTVCSLPITDGEALAGALSA
jgi:uncharacterized protein YyaL (SSP411 family)